MGTPNVFNILKSQAVLWTAPVGEPFPDPGVILAGDDWAGNWERLGATKAPLAAKLEVAEHESQTEEFLAAVRRFKTGEKFTLETVLAELTADYLALAAGGTPTPAGSGVPYDELVIGNEAYLPEAAWGFEGILYDEVGNMTPVRVFIPRATAKINGDLKFSRRDDDYTGIPLVIQALADTEDVSNPGRIFVLHYVTPAGS